MNNWMGRPKPNVYRVQTDSEWCRELATIDLIYYIQTTKPSEVQTKERAWYRLQKWPDCFFCAVTAGASGGGGHSAAHLSSQSSWSVLASPGRGAGVSSDNESSFLLSRECKGGLLSNLHDLKKTPLESLRAARAAYVLERTTSRRSRRHASQLIAESLPGARSKANVRPCRFRFGWHTDLWISVLLLVAGCLSHVSPACARSRSGFRSASCRRALCMSSSS